MIQEAPKDPKICRHFLLGRCNIRECRFKHITEEQSAENRRAKKGTESWERDNNERGGQQYHNNRGDNNRQQARHESRTDSGGYNNNNHGRSDRWSHSNDGQQQGRNGNNGANVGWTSSKWGESSYGEELACESPYNGGDQQARFSGDTHEQANQKVVSRFDNNSHDNGGYGGDASRPNNNQMMGGPSPVGAQNAAPQNNYGNELSINSYNNGGPNNGGLNNANNYGPPQQPSPMNNNYNSSPMNNNNNSYNVNCSPMNNNGNNSNGYNSNFSQQLNNNYGPTNTNSSPMNNSSAMNNSNAGPYTNTSSRPLANSSPMANTMNNYSTPMNTSYGNNYNSGTPHPANNNGSGIGNNNLGFHQHGGNNNAQGDTGYGGNATPAGNGGGKAFKTPPAPRPPAPGNVNHLTPINGINGFSNQHGLTPINDYSDSFSSGTDRNTGNFGNTTHEYGGEQFHNSGAGQQMQQGGYSSNYSNELPNHLDNYNHGSAGQQQNHQSNNGPPTQSPYNNNGALQRGPEISNAHPAALQHPSNQDSQGQPGSAGMLPDGTQILYDDHGCAHFDTLNYEQGYNTAMSSPTDALGGGPGGPSFYGAPPSHGGGVGHDYSPWAGNTSAADQYYSASPCGADGDMTTMSHLYGTPSMPSANYGFNNTTPPAPGASTTSVTTLPQATPKKLQLDVGSRAQVTQKAGPSVGDLASLIMGAGPPVSAPAQPQPPAPQPQQQQAAAQQQQEHRRDTAQMSPRAQQMSPRPSVPPSPLARAGSSHASAVSERDRVMNSPRVRTMSEAHGAQYQDDGILRQRSCTDDPRLTPSQQHGNPHQSFHQYQDSQGNCFPQPQAYPVAAPHHAHGHHRNSQSHILVQDRTCSAVTMMGSMTRDSQDMHHHPSSPYHHGQSLSSHGQPMSAPPAHSGTASAPQGSPLQGSSAVPHPFHGHLSRREPYPHFSTPPVRPKTRSDFDYNNVGTAWETMSSQSHPHGRAELVSPCMSPSHRGYHGSMSPVMQVRQARSMSLGTAYLQRPSVAPPPPPHDQNNGAVNGECALSERHHSAQTAPPGGVPRGSPCPGQHQPASHQNSSQQRYNNEANDSQRASMVMTPPPGLLHDQQGAAAPNMSILHLLHDKSPEQAGHQAGHQQHDDMIREQQQGPAGHRTPLHHGHHRDQQNTSADQRDHAFAERQNRPQTVLLQHLSSANSGQFAVGEHSTPTFCGGSCMETPPTADPRRDLFGYSTMFEVGSAPSGSSDAAYAGRNEPTTVDGEDM